ncbi:MAG TPA: TonB-dependent receptor [Thermoanaerobaculia bacterium]|jgi:iron complex outermembrane receptor protein|nr:TonB-dependent receptor [Thermoanaerobaculia bacterium]
MAFGRTVRTLSIGILVSLFAVSLFAAQGHIAGRITRTDGGGGIGGVIVQVLETGDAQLSDANGDFRFDVAPGTYSLQFVAGEQVATEQNVVVASGGTARVDKKVDWKLSVAETITVYSASRRVERVVEAPAAVTVMSQEDVAAVAPSGQAPRIVESAPGVDFTNSGLYDTNFNARGFNSSLNRRILTLVDGRDPAIAFLGAQEWAALSFPLDEMASVELVRGPGSALYGANAFSGVLNMTTRSPKTSPGGRLLLSAGDLNTKRGDIRHAGALGGEWYYRLVGGYQQSDDFARSRNLTVEYTTPCATTAQINCLRREATPLALEEVNIRFGGLRFDKHFENSSVFTAEGGYSTIEGPVFQTGIGRVQVTDVERPWTRLNYNMPHFNIGGYWDARKADNQVALASNARLYEDSSNLHGELQTNWDFFKSRMRLIGGVAYNSQEVDTANPQGVQTLMLEAHDERQQSVFGQAEFDVTQKIKLVGAGRWDDSTLHEPQFSPKAAIVVTPTTNHTFRYGYNEAFQRPNYSELFLAAPAGAPANLAGAAAANPAAAALSPILGQLGFGAMPILARGNADLDVEKIRSHELGYAGIYGGKLFVTVDLYQSHLSNFVTDLLPGVNQAAFPAYQIPTTLPATVQAGLRNFLGAALGSNFAGLTTVNGAPALVLSYTNAGEVDTRGGELAFNYYVNNNWILDFNYSHFDFEVEEGTQAAGDRLLPNAPEQKFNLGMAFRGAKLDAKVTYRWVEGYDWAAGIFVGSVPQFDVVNVSANYRITNMFGFGVDISNALDDEHYESFGGDLMARRALGFVSINW